MINRDIKSEIYKHLKYNKPFLISWEDYILRNLVKTGKIETTLSLSFFMEDGSLRILYPKAFEVTFYIKDVKNFDNIFLYMNREINIVIIIENELVHFPIECVQRLIDHLGPKDNVIMICRGHIFFVYNRGYLELYDTYAIENICGGIKLNNENIFATNVKSLLNDKTRVLMVCEDEYEDEHSNFDGVYGLSLSYRVDYLPEVLASVKYLEYRDESDTLSNVCMDYIRYVMEIFDTSKENFRRRFPNIETIVVPEFTLVESDKNGKKYKLEQSIMEAYRLRRSPQRGFRFPEVVYRLCKELIDNFNNRIVDYTSNVVKRKTIILDLNCKA